MAVKQTKQLGKQTVTTTVAANEFFVKVNDTNKVTLIKLNDIKAALLAGLDLNAMEDGIFVVTHRNSDGYPFMYKPHKWPSIQASGEIATGVAVVEGGKILVIAPTEAASLLWSSAAVTGGGVASTDRLVALGDFAGKDNTAAQIQHAECQGAKYAPGFCAQYSRPNTAGTGLLAGKWWLPSVGEMMMIYANMIKINYALSLIEGAQPLSEAYYWTSTESGPATAWILALSSGTMLSLAKATTRLPVRPVSAFIR